ncbi:MAG: ATP-binding cassette domain-containing protein, partial [Gaiellales bacterium]
KVQRAREGDLAGATHEMLNSIRVVQTFGRGGHDERSFVMNSGRAMDAALRAARLDAWFSWIVNFFEAVAIAAVLWIGVGLLESGQLSLGTLTLVTVLIRQMFKPSRKVIKEWNIIAKVFASVERIADLLDRPITVHDEPGAQSAPRLRGQLEFRHVDFAYDKAGYREPVGEERRAALADVSFRVDPGEVVAISGPSGAGKTTIAQLVPRLYDPQAGCVLLDGHDVREFTLDSVRAQISMVLQDTLLLSGTVADNIAYGKPEATREEILTAARRAHADDFIRLMPDAYDTDLTEQGSNLSAGQRQRIAIARALIRDTPILILDEPTTGLDVESTETVLAGLRELMEGRTTILITHDLDLVASADRIFMLDHGRLTESGTHGELLEREGLYASLRQRRTISIGGSHADGNGGSGGDLLDARLVPALRRDAPDLDTALDGEAMGLRMQRLLGRAAARWTVDACRPTKMLYAPERGCSLRYAVTLTTPKGTRRELLVGARLFPDCDAAARFLSRIGPLAHEVAGHPQIRPLANPASQLTGLAMVAYAFPIDPDLPALVAATNPAQMAEWLSPIVTKGTPGHRAHPLRIDVERYPRRDRCLLRYENGFGCIYGKLHGKPSDELIAVHEALGAVVVLQTPTALGSLQEIGLVLLQPLPGSTTVGRMLRGIAKEASPEALEHAVAQSASVAAMLHSSSAAVRKVHTLDDELARLGSELAGIEPLVPELAERLDRLAEAATCLARDGSPPELVPSHGDFTPSQVVMAGQDAGLVDMDDVCRADPALDLGRFSAYLRVGCRKAAPAAEAIEDRLCEVFREAYGRARELSDHDAAELRTRIAAYEAAALAHMVVQGWLQLKPARASLALTILEERVTCLHATAR